MKKTPGKKARPANLKVLVQKEVKAVQALCDRLPNGRSMLADFLQVRLSEVSRYFARPPGRIPSGMILAGMRAFVLQNSRKQRAKVAREPRVVCHTFVDDRPSEMHCEYCDATEPLPPFFTPNGPVNTEHGRAVRKFIQAHRGHASVGK